jgi:hypothetical protein
MALGFGNSDMPYAERVKTISNDGEYLFEKYCTEKLYDFYRIGFDEHKNSVPNYWRLNEVLRNLPDYVVNAKGKMYVVCVKGTDKFKEKEIKLMDKMLDAFNSSQAPLVYAFCFKENSAPIWMYPKKIVELYNDSEDNKWHDGVIFRDLKIRKV